MKSVRYTHLFLLLCIVFILLNSNNSTLTTTSREREREGRQTPPHTPSCFWKKKSVTLQNNLCNSNSNSHVQYDDAAAVVRYVGGGYVRISSFFFKIFKICPKRQKSIYFFNGSRALFYGPSAVPESYWICHLRSHYS